MATCDVCGNDDDKAFQVVAADGGEHVFDSFECATHAGVAGARDQVD